jgi:MFS family permease
MLGKAKMFKFGLGLFTFGSLLCGITNSFPILILARIVQAVGAAGTMANNQGIITETFPQNERGKALGFLSWLYRSNNFTGLYCRNYFLYSIHFCGKETRKSTITTTNI